jgi:NADH-quinone oxidoreductase subunit K
MDIWVIVEVTFILFWMGVLGLLANRRNMILILMSIELFLLASTLNLIIGSVLLDDINGQVFALFVLTVAAAESAVGLALILSYFRLRNSLSMEHYQVLKDERM